MISNVEDDQEGKKKEMEDYSANLYAAFKHLFDTIEVKRRKAKRRGKRSHWEED